jgi:hypothetical protein
MRSACEGHPSLSLPNEKRDPERGDDLHRALQGTKGARVLLLVVPEKHPILLRLGLCEGT